VRQAYSPDVRERGERESEKATAGGKNGVSSGVGGWREIRGDAIRADLENYGEGRTEEDNIFLSHAVDHAG